MTIQEKLGLLSSGELEVLRQLFFHGPTWDGNIVCKNSRGGLFRRAMAQRYNGWTYLTGHGIECAVDFGLNDAKDKWERDRRRAA